MMADIDGAIRALRDEIVKSAGIEGLPEYGEGTDFSTVLSPFLAYRVADAQVQTPGSGHGYAVLDTVTVVPFELFYCRKDAAGTESLAAVRSALSSLLNAVAGSPRAFDHWGTVPAGLVRIEVTGIQTGDYGAYFLEHYQGWAGLSATLQMTILS